MNGPECLPAHGVFTTSAEELESKKQNEEAMRLEVKSHANKHRGDLPKQIFAGVEHMELQNRWRVILYQTDHAKMYYLELSQNPIFYQDLVTGFDRIRNMDYLIRGSTAPDRYWVSHGSQVIEKVDDIVKNHQQTTE